MKKEIKIIIITVLITSFVMLIILTNACKNKLNEEKPNDVNPVVELEETKLGYDRLQSQSEEIGRLMEIMSDLFDYLEIEYVENEFCAFDLLGGNKIECIDDKPIIKSK